MVQVIADHLHSNTRYYYQFTMCGGAVASPIGMTMTAPDCEEDVESVNFATVSCSSYETAYFSAYGRVAEKADNLNFVMHLGGSMHLVCAAYRRFFCCGRTNECLIESEVSAVCFALQRTCASLTHFCFLLTMLYIFFLIWTLNLNPTGSSGDYIYGKRDCM
jgi:hypothetical protein